MQFVISFILVTRPRRFIEIDIMNKNENENENDINVINVILLKMTLSITYRRLQQAGSRKLVINEYFLPQNVFKLNIALLCLFVSSVLNHRRPIQCVVSYQRFHTLCMKCVYECTDLYMNYTLNWAAYD